MIKRLTFSNFRQHEHFDHEFEDGLTVIVGPNGSGKSTVFEVISWILYGSAAVRGKAETIQRIGSTERPSGRLEIEIGGAVFVVERTLKDATVTSAVTGEVMASSSRGVTEFVEETLLGQSRQEFFATAMTQQKELMWLKGMSGPERQRFIGKLMGHEVLTPAQKGARERLRDAKARTQALTEQAFDSEPPLSDEELAALTARLEVCRSGLSVASGDEATAKAHQGQCQAAASEMTGKAAEHESLVTAVSNADSALVKVDGDIERGEAEQVRLTELVGTLEVKRDSARALAAGVETLATLVQGDEKAAGATRDEATTARALLKQAETDRDKIADVGSDAPCPVCDRPLGEDWDDHVQELTVNVERLKAELVPLVDGSQVAAGKLKESNTAHAQAVQDANTAQTTADAIVRDLEKREKVDSALTGLHETRAEAARSLEGARTAVVDLGFDAGAVSKLQDALTEATRAVDKAVRDRTLEEGEVTRVAQEITKADETRVRHEREQGRIKEAATAQVLFTAVDGMFSELRAWLNESVRPAISAAASQILVETTGGRFDRLVLNADYVPELYADGQLLPVVSGGEEDVMSIALRIAVGQVVASGSGTPLEFLLMDEPLGSLDDERQKLVLGSLRELCKTQFRQIIVVTHEASAIDNADHVLELGRYAGRSDEETELVALQSEAASAEWREKTSQHMEEYA